MRAFRKFVVVAATMATLAGLGVAVGAGTAMADPVATPGLTKLVGVGSDTVTPLFDNGNGTSTSPGCLGDETGTFVHDYNATGPTYGLASWDAVNPCTGVADDTITAKSKGTSDTSCQLERPDGSSAGIAALNTNQTDTNKDSAGQTVYCLDYARSSRAPNTTSFEDAFVTLAQDGIAWSYPTCSNSGTGCATNGGPTTNPQPAALGLTLLQDIYTCKDKNWDEVGGKTSAPIGVVIPQSGSGTRSSWLTELGITATSEPCWQNGTVTVNGTSTVIEENTGLSTGNVAQFTTTQTIDGKAIPPQDDIFPYSIGDWIAQTAKANGVGGHATTVWGHGNMALGETKNAAGVGEVAVTMNSSSQRVINPAWNPQFLRTLYGVTRNGCYVSSDPTSTDVCLPTRTPPAGGTVYPTYETTGLKAFFGPTGWMCTNATAAKDIVSYGFTTLSTCGDLTAGD